MDTSTLKKFSQKARRQLLEQVSARMEQVLRSDSVEIREKAKVVAELKAQIEKDGKAVVIDRVAYTWFNRFCALRFMDVNHYTRIGAVSPAENGTQPEILLEAKQGYVDGELGKYVNQQMVFDLLGGRHPSSDAQGEAYRLLLVGICNYYGEFMPLMFEKIEDYTELLMPLDLLSENSVFHYLREALTPDVCEDVEVIGWLYQYYISERKDEVFEALKNNQKIEAEDIPAATQLFTPHWIVRYLVENSLGRLWMLNYPDSKLAQYMEYYISPAQKETEFLKVASPEELRLLDPACGSGHILTYAFDLLYLIYEETGYQASDISHLILERNLYGIEIDLRAGALAAFALTMKARSKDRRFLTRDVQPNICVLENVIFNDAELKQYMNAVGRNLFTEPLMKTLRQFEQAKNLGSLIRPMLTDAGYVRSLLEEKNLGGDLFLFGVHERVMKVLKQAEFLAPLYHVVVANPPYMGDIGMNDDLRKFLKNGYLEFKSDLFSSFAIRCSELGIKDAGIGIMCPNVWLYLPTYEKLRSVILKQKTLVTLVELPLTGFKGATVQICAYVFLNRQSTEDYGSFIRLVDFKGGDKEMATYTLDAIHNPDCNYFYRTSISVFNQIPGSPIAYWAKNKIIKCFEFFPPVETKVQLKAGISTGDNTVFLREWYEIVWNNFSITTRSNEETLSNNISWYPCNSGGQFRKWYGNHDTVINWRNNGKSIRNYGKETGKIRSAVRNESYYFKKGITWTKISTGYFAARWRPEGFLFDDTGRCGFAEDQTIELVLGLFCSCVAKEFLKMLSPTMSFTSGELAKIPIPSNVNPKISELVNSCVSLGKQDWDSSEMSWDFTKLPLFEYEHKTTTLSSTYSSVRAQWKENTFRMKQQEEEVNHIFIEACGLQSELSPNLSLKEITLTCNPYYRYGSKRSEEELEELLRADAMKEFISYAVGCMFGRYSLDKPSLVLANQGEALKDYLKQVTKPTFTPDEDNVIPVLEGEWFEDDIAERFKKFLRVTFGEEHYDENLAFIEEAIGRDVRSYFVKEFYKDHVQTYKKRPIYWMFSSPKGSFNALIYMHRYQPDTVSIVLNGYLREYIKKLSAHKSQLERTSVSGSASQSQKTKALKEVTQVNKVLSELKEYEDDVLYPLATEQVKIDLDDGVKVNYVKFGEALSPIKGL